MSGRGGLGVLRARRRTSAFVYGNITVLGAVVAVLATALTTFVAHVVADVVSSRVTEDAAAPQRRSAGSARSARSCATPRRSRRPARSPRGCWRWAC